MTPTHQTGPSPASGAVPGRRRATVADVAKDAGVSSATVSRVLNDLPVDPALVERVRASAARLRYRPSRMAKNLRTRQSTVWCLIISDIRNPFFTDMVRGVEDVAHLNDRSLVLCNSEDDLDKERRYIELAIDEQMGGVIVSPASIMESDLEPLQSTGIPVVMVDRTCAAPVDSVTLDNPLGSRWAVERLSTSGRRRIACIAGPQRTSTGQERLHGYQRAVEELGLDTDPELTVEADFTEAGGRRAMEQLLALATPPDGVYVTNNLMTVGALSALRAARVALPGTMGLVGFDDSTWATLVDPPLTTIGQQTYAMGQQVAQFLLDRQNGHQGQPRRTILEPHLHVRGSA